MPKNIEEIIEDIASGRIKVDSDVKNILPSIPERYLFQDGENTLIRHS